MATFKFYELDQDNMRQPEYGFGRHDRAGFFKFITEEEFIFIKLKYPNAVLIKADKFDCPPPEYEV